MKSAHQACTMSRNLFDCTRYRLPRVRSSLNEKGKRRLRSRMFPERRAPSVFIRGAHELRNETGGILVVCSERWSGEESRRLIKHPWGARRLCRVVGVVLMPGARNKRCRQARPLTGVGRLKERERPGDGDAHQCRTPVALGAQRSPTPVKGGIARVPWLRGMKGEKEYACSYTSVCFL